MERHGRTIAFKGHGSYHLAFLSPHNCSKKNQSDKNRHLTSGDTGKAALAGFADVPPYKHHRLLSKRWRKYDSRTPNGDHEAGDNTLYMVAEETSMMLRKVKELFADKLSLLASNYSSAKNSINIGRLCPQIVYYVFAYAQLVKRRHSYHWFSNEPLSFQLALRHILAAYYASIGVPINKLICASNRKWCTCWF